MIDNTLEGRGFNRDTGRTKLDPVKVIVWSVISVVTFVFWVGFIYLLGSLFGSLI